MTKLVADRTYLIATELEECANARQRAVLLTMWDALGPAFCAAPAASTTKHHHCWPGGLADHSLQVLEHLNVLALDAPFMAGARDDAWCDDVLVAGLFHDLGKIDAYAPLAAPASDGRLYRTTDAAWPSHAQRSLYLLAQHGVTLSERLYQAILLHDGQYVDANRGWAMKEPDLALLLHWADVWSARHAGPAPSVAP